MKGLAGRAARALAGALTRALSAASEPRVIAFLVVALGFALALLLRLAPMRWGVYLNEFDPFYEYYLAEKVLEKGGGDPLRGMAWWFSWWFNRGEKDTLFWAPKGRDLRATSQPGAAFFSATTYAILRALGLDVDLYTVHAFIPAVGAATASIFVYFLAREMWDSSAGVLASLLITCSWPFIYRTNLGAKHEGIAIPLVLLSMTLLIQSAKRGSLLRGLGAGLAMGLAVLSWGGFLYPWNLISLAVLAWLLLNPGDVKLARAYLAFVVVTDLFIAATPRFGPKTAFYSPAAFVPWLAVAASVLSLAHAMPSRRTVARMGRRTVAVVVLACAAGLVAAWWAGLLATLPGRILAVLVPVWRPVGVTTVAEHAVPTWASIYGDYGLLIPLSAFGALICGYRARRRFEDLLALLLWASSAYAASSMARLTLLLAPAVALLASAGFSELVERLLALRGTGRRYRRGRVVSGELLGLTLVILSLLLLPPLLNYRAVLATHQPPLILASSVPVVDYNYQYMDWISALEWIRANVPRGSVIATWWDYGYWISVNTLRNTTCDNATLDSKQIRKIARAFLSSEEEALRIFRELNVSYVVVFEPFLRAQVPYLGGYAYYSPAYGGIGGDLAKSYQMARWIGEDPEKYVTFGQIDSYPVLVPADTPEARNATLYHLLFVKTGRRRFFVFEPLPLTGRPLANYKGPSLTIPQPKYFKLVYASQPNEWVLVFKVEYPQAGGRP